MIDSDESCYESLKGKIEFKVKNEEASVCNVHLKDLNEEDVGEWRVDLRNRENDVWYFKSFSVKLEDIQASDGPDEADEEGPTVPINRSKLS